MAMNGIGNNCIHDKVQLTLHKGSSKDGKGGKRWVLGRWSRQTSFKMISPRRVERERPLGGFARQAKGKALG
jgi:hypothetical protein